MSSLPPHNWNLLTAVYGRRNLGADVAERQQSVRRAALIESLTVASSEHKSDSQLIITRVWRNGSTNYKFMCRAASGHWLPVFVFGSFGGWCRVWVAVGEGVMVRGWWLGGVATSPLVFNN